MDQQQREEFDTELNGDPELQAMWDYVLSVQAAEEEGIN